MSQNDLLEKLKDIAGESQVRTDEPMSSHTTFRIGGTADYFVMPSSVEELQAIIRLSERIRHELLRYRPWQLHA